jgi:hypothetical protein
MPRFSNDFDFKTNKALKEMIQKGFIPYAQLRLKEIRQQL